MQCTIIDTGNDNTYKPGESLPPNARGVFHDLGLSYLLEDAVHLSCTGNLTSWGTDELLSRYFFAEPFGNGWHLDRLLFEAQLKNEAITLGADWRENCAFLSMSSAGRDFGVQARDGQGRDVALPAAFVIDCSGRAAVVARNAGIRRHVLDSLVAYCVILDGRAEGLNGVTFIEAVRDGWWYAAPLPQDRVVVNYMSDSDFHKVPARDMDRWLTGKLAETRYLEQTLAIADHGTLKHAMVKTATTSVLTTPAGDGWLAVGDALCTYDPLTSFGITIAMAGAKQAAEAVTRHLDGDAQAIGRYLAMQQDTFNTSLGMLQTQYGLEKRWTNEPFWQRRQ